MVELDLDLSDTKRISIKTETPIPWVCPECGQPADMMDAAEEATQLEYARVGDKIHGYCPHCEKFQEAFVVKSLKITLAQVFVENNAKAA